MVRAASPTRTATEQIQRPRISRSETRNKDGGMSSTGRVGVHWAPLKFALLVVAVRTQHRHLGMGMPLARGVEMERIGIV